MYINKIEPNNSATRPIKYVSTTTAHSEPFSSVTSTNSALPRVNIALNVLKIQSCSTL